jgi:hypothetical protein
MYKKRAVFAFIFLLLLSLFAVLAAPTAPPFEIPEMDGSDSTTDDSDEEPVSTSSQTTQTQETLSDVPDEPQIPVSQQTQASSSTENVTVANVTISNTWLIVIVTLLGLNLILLFVLILSSAIHILKDKHPFLAFKYKQADLEKYQNTPDSIEYTKTFVKLFRYIDQYYKSYTYEQIREVLSNEGFTNEEIESVYNEVVKNVR